MVCNNAIVRGAIDFESENDAKIRSEIHGKLKPLEIKASEITLNGELVISNMAYGVADPSVVFSSGNQPKEGQLYFKIIS